MNLIKIFLMLGLISIVSSIPAKEIQQNQDKADNIQAKRDLSLSYAATDIGSKEGTRVKTITVIKNIAGKKDKPLKIDEKLHKDDDWGSHFRDNFDKYGAIPDIPDIDELFDFVNKKEDKKPKEDKPPTEKDEGKKEETDESESEEDSKDAATTVLPAPVEEVVNEEKVEKILGDAELIQPGSKQGKVKSQSLDLGKYRVKESTIEDYQPLQRNAARASNKNEKYIASASVEYYYPQPKPTQSVNPNTFPNANVYQPPQTQKGRGSVSLSTSSGKKFDVPLNNVTDSPPYIAPSFRRNQNSPSEPQFITSSQRPYIAPNVRKSYEVQLSKSNSSNCTTASNNSTSNSQQTNFFNYQEVPTSFKSNRFGVYKSNIPRSRGLRY